MMVASANAAVIDIMELADGGYEIFSNGARYGGVTNRVAAEKVAQKLSEGNNTINWTPKTNIGGGASTNTTGVRASINKNGTFRSEPFTRAGTEYIREETVGGQIRYKNVATGRYVSNAEALGTNVPTTTSKPGTNLPATTTKPGSNLPTTTSKPGTNLPTTTTKPGSNLPTTTSKPGTNLPTTTTKPGSNLPTTTSKPGTNLPTTTTKPGSNLPTTTSKPGTNLPTTTGGGEGNVPPTGSSPKSVSAPKPGVNVGGVAMGAVGLVTGVIGVADSVKAKETKTTWGDVATGALSGGTALAGVAAIVNAIPVGGQIAYGAAMAAGAAVGATGAVNKMFSETDCDMDPVTGQYACCNVSNLTNIQARYCNIGDEMFAAFPYVRTCMQGKNKYESNWFKARFLDDHWSDTPKVKFCHGYIMPVDGDYKIQPYGSSEETGKVCWKWECADDGLVRNGARCVRSGTASENGVDAVDGTAAAIKVGDPCPVDRLSQYATAGIYIRGGRNGPNAFTCAATACRDGTYLVKNERGESQGWCRAGTAPGGDTLTDVSANGDGVTSGDGNTQNNVLIIIAPDAADIMAQQNIPVPASNNCELGTAGYLMYNGKCITEYEYQEIQRAMVADQQRAATQKIATAVEKINEITSSFKQSVWKNEEGKFNTSRLVSDSVAGVVLGTAGGLITSSVVKKNQVKNGFEDIKCVVGGQVVADYGDEFLVGVQ